MQRDIEELESLLTSINRSAERLQPLWFTFIGLSLYFVLTALTTSHRMLLLEDPQTLPLINLKIPLLAFYVIAPIFYLAIHFYILSMLVLLAGSASAFEATLRGTLPIESDRERFRMRLENILFLQLLSGPIRERTGFNSMFLGTLALFTIAITPCVTLLVMQLKFLPYHSFGITWLHRGFVLLDWVMVQLMWRGYRFRWGRIAPRSPIQFWRQRGPRWGLSTAGRVTALLLVLWITLVEGRWAGEPWIDPFRDEIYMRQAGVELPNSYEDSLNFGESSPNFGAVILSEWNNGPDWRSRVVRDGVRPLLWMELFSDRLSLRNELIVGSELLDETRKEALRGPPNRFLPTRDFRGRDFTGANFTKADLRGVDFSLSDAEFLFQRTILRRAILDGALLDEARFDYADMAEASLQEIHANGASLNRVNLSSADLSGAWLNGAKITVANLTCAKLIISIANAADFSDSLMSGIEADGTILDGAMLTSITMIAGQLKGSRVNGTKISSSKIKRTQFSVEKTSALSFYSNSIGYPDTPIYVEKNKYIDSLYVRKFERTVYQGVSQFIIGDPSGLSSCDTRYKRDPTRRNFFTSEPLERHEI